METMDFFPPKKWKEKIIISASIEVVAIKQCNPKSNGPPGAI